MSRRSPVADRFATYICETTEAFGELTEKVSVFAKAKPIRTVAEHENPRRSGDDWLLKLRVVRRFDLLAVPEADAEEPAQPLRIAPTRGPPAWEEEAAPLPLPDPLAQPEPDFQFDQTVSW